MPCSPVIAFKRSLSKKKILDESRSRNQLFGSIHIITGSAIREPRNTASELQALPLKRSLNYDDGVYFILLQEKYIGNHAPRKTFSSFSHGVKREPR